MNRRQSFRSWLKKQRSRNDRVGDLSRDSIQDSDLPRIRTEKSWLKYLNDMNACNGALDAVVQAWKEYREYLNG